MIKWFKNKYKQWQFDREKKKFAGSEEPWVVVRGESIDPEKGLKFDMDWNEAFIKHLRANGVKGTRDEDVIAFWLTMINQQMIGVTEQDDD